jgi:hypothetical protein
VESVRNRKPDCYANAPAIGFAESAKGMVKTGRGFATTRVVFSEECSQFRTAVSSRRMSRGTCYCFFDVNSNSSNFILSASSWIALLTALHKRMRVCMGMLVGKLIA